MLEPDFVVVKARDEYGRDKASALDITQMLDYMDSISGKGPAPDLKG